MDDRSLLIPQISLKVLQCVSTDRIIHCLYAQQRSPRRRDKRCARGCKLQSIWLLVDFASRSVDGEPVLDAARQLKVRQARDIQLTINLVARCCNSAYAWVRRYTDKRSWVLG